MFQTNKFQTNKFQANKFQKKKVSDKPARREQLATQSIYPGRIIQEFTIPEEGICKSGRHAYLMLVKDDRRIRFLHRATLHKMAMGLAPKPWNVTCDVEAVQAPQAVMFPPMVLPNTNQPITVHLLQQQLLNFQLDEDLQVQEPIGTDVLKAMSEQIWTCHAMYVSAMLMSYFLECHRTHQEALTPTPSWSE
jgi:hypothetical protein